MTYRDRTSEFSSIVQSLQSHHVHKRQTTTQPSDFMAAAKKIGYELNCTVAKLEQLTELAKGRSLFGDPAMEIQELTRAVKQDISKLNSDIAALQELAKSRSGQQGKHVRSHSSAVVMSLQTKLAGMSSDFKGVLELRTENLKHQKQRREQFSTAPLSLMNSPMSGEGGESLLLGMANGSADVSIDMDSLQHRNQQHAQIMQEQDSYIQERADAMENIHSTIVELGQIFRQLAHMVKEQEEQVMRVDANTEETHMNIDAAHGELLKYFKGVTSNRWLMIKIFGVVLVFFIIFIVFLT